MAKKATRPRAGGNLPIQTSFAVGLPAIADLARRRTSSVPPNGHCEPVCDALAPDPAMRFILRVTWSLGWLQSEVAASEGADWQKAVAAQLKSGDAESLVQLQALRWACDEFAASAFADVPTEATEQSAQTDHATLRRQLQRVPDAATTPNARRAWALFPYTVGLGVVKDYERGEVKISEALQAIGKCGRAFGQENRTIIHVGIRAVLD
jgi:hypothetical protein